MARDRILAALFIGIFSTVALGCGRGGSKPMPQSGFSVAFEEHHVPSKIGSGAQVSADITVKNTSPATWPSKPNHKGLNAVNLSYHWLDSKGKVIVFDGLRTPLPRDISPNERVSLRAMIQTPEREGSYILEITLVQEGVAWFPEKDGDKLTVAVNVVEATTTASDVAGLQPPTRAGDPGAQNKKSIHLDKTKEPLLTKENAVTSPVKTEASPGTTSVTDKVKGGGDRKAHPWGVQVGAFPQGKDAESLAKKFREKGYEADVVVVQVKGRKWHRVLIGRLATRAEAKTLQETLKTAEKLERSIIARR